MPAEIDVVERRIRQLEIERVALKKETDPASQERLAKLEQELGDLRESSSQLKARWDNEKRVIEKIRKTKEEIENTRMQAEAAERRGDLNKAAELRYGVMFALNRQLQTEQAEFDALNENGQAMLQEEVTADDIAEVVGKWTGIPVSRLLEGEMQKLLRMEDRLHARVVGQEEAVVAVANSVRRSRSGLSDPNRPIGSFIFLGPTGVGKTELARALAEFLFDDERAMLRLDMSEYMEKHTVARLIGAPPGYVGYEEGGQLTEAVRRRPYSVLLLDEIEKAHPDVFNVLLQLLDDGRLTDGQGRTVDFRNTVIIMTSNIGSQWIQELALTDTVLMRTRVMEAVQSHFRPEFLNRVDEIILFQSLSLAQIKSIVEIQLGLLRKRLAERKLTMTLTDAAGRGGCAGGLRSGLRRASAQTRHSEADCRPTRAAYPGRRVPRRRPHLSGRRPGRRPQLPQSRRTSACHGIADSVRTTQTRTADQNRQARRKMSWLSVSVCILRHF